MCETEGCAHKGSPLVECNCADNQHQDLPASCGGWFYSKGEYCVVLAERESFLRRGGVNFFKILNVVSWLMSAIDVISFLASHH